MSTSPTPLELDDTLQPQLPAGDDAGAASEIGTFAISRVNALADELAQFAAVRSTQAPRCALDINDLQAALAYAVLNWIIRWPS